ncbi:MAG: four helix bundle protein, partial [Gillisia sp.]
EFSRFLYIASGSAFELEYLIFASCELKFIEKTESENLLAKVEEIKKMLFSLIKKIKQTL